MYKDRIILIGLAILIFLFLYRTEGQDQISEIYKYNSPGSEHQMLRKFEGNWRQLYSSFPQNSPAIFGSGNSVNEILYGGRYVKMTTELEVNNLKVSSLMTLGYDRMAKEYFLFAIDGIGTGYIFAKGSYNIKDRKMILLGENNDSMTKKLIKFKIEIEFENDRKYIYRMFIVENGKERKHIEIYNIKLEGTQ